MSSPLRTPAAVAGDPGRPRSLSLLAATTPPPNPKDRGPLLTPDEIAEQVFNGKVSGRWVLANLPLDLRVKVGRLICFRLHDAERYLDSLSKQGGQG
jgi:hypothetical protein